MSPAAIAFLIPDDAHDPSAFSRTEAAADFPSLGAREDVVNAINTRLRARGITRGRVAPDTGILIPDGVDSVSLTSTHDGQARFILAIRPIDELLDVLSDLGWHVVDVGSGDVLSSPHISPKNHSTTAVTSGARTGPATSWNLLYESADVASFLLPRDDLAPGLRIEVERERPDILPSGWTGQAGPAIPQNTWPRSPGSGLPMRHVLTLWLPQDYLVRGPGFPGISVFQGDSEGDQADVRPDADPSDSFVASLATARPHPQLISVLPDFAPRRFALLWLTHDEIAPGPVPPPPDIRRPGEHTSRGPNAWDDPQPQKRVWLVPREDPNTGIAPGSSGYRDARDAETGEMEPWASTASFEFANHLGGTFVEIDWSPQLSPYFLQLDRSPGLQLGTPHARNGILVVDLKEGSIFFLA